MLNRITIMGRMTATPELRTTPGGSSVTSFTLAVERDFKDKETGERPVDFIDCVAWNGPAEFITRFLSKGRMAVVNGSLQTRKYIDKDGNNRRTMEIKVDKAYFADSITGGNSQPEPQYEELRNDEDLPF